MNHIGATARRQLRFRSLRAAASGAAANWEPVTRRKARWYSGGSVPGRDAQRTRFRHPMKIYTRTGDGGSTGLFGGPRVAKDDDRIEAYGTIDELNAAIGVTRSAGVESAIDAQLAHIQHDLFALGAELATPDPDRHHLRTIRPAHIETLEQWIDAHELTLPPLKNFVLPAGAAAACYMHVARAVCRRAERRVVTLARRAEANVSEEAVVYLNRLSDLLFVLARVVNQQAGVEDAPWRANERVDR